MNGDSQFAYQLFSSAVHPNHLQNARLFKFIPTCFLEQGKILFNPSDSQNLHNILLIDRSASNFVEDKLLISSSKCNTAIPPGFGVQTTDKRVDERYRRNKVNYSVSFLNYVPATCSTIGLVFQVLGASRNLYSQLRTLI